MIGNLARRANRLRMKRCIRHRRWTGKRLCHLMVRQGPQHATFTASQVGPFDQWPTGMGFEYFYGFVGGDTSQWEPNLFRNTTAIYPYVGHPSWNLTTAMADDAIQRLNEINQIDPSKPFFCYYVPGGIHAPHHATPEWIKKISDMHLFDEGWNKLRETIFANQKRLGVIPQDAKMTPWPDKLLKNWDDLTADEKKMFIRQVDVYAAYLAYTDHEIGRVIQAVEDMGKLDNTIIIYISGDNGSSAEGTLVGTPNEVASLNGVQIPVEDQLKYFYDVWGSDRTYNHMRSGGLGRSTRRFRGPSRSPPTLAAPGRACAFPGRATSKMWAASATSSITLLMSFRPSLKSPAFPRPRKWTASSRLRSKALALRTPLIRPTPPSRHHTQYFEMVGDHAIYHDGWIASTKAIRPPWEVVGPQLDPFNNCTWELYDLTKDWTQDEDVTAKYPEKVKEMKELFATEARKYEVLPLDASVATRLAAPRPNITAGRSVFTYTTPMTGIPQGDSPLLLNCSYTITADVEIPDDGAEGMILTLGVGEQRSRKPV